MHFTINPFLGVFIDIIFSWHCSKTIIFPFYQLATTFIIMWLPLRTEKGHCSYLCWKPFSTGLVENQGENYLKNLDNVYVSAVGTPFYQQVLPSNSVHLGYSVTSTHMLRIKYGILLHIFHFLTCIVQWIILVDLEIFIILISKWPHIWVPCTNLYKHREHWKNDLQLWPWPIV